MRTGRRPGCAAATCRGGPRRRAPRRRHVVAMPARFPAPTRRCRPAPRASTARGSSPPAAVSSPAVATGSERHRSTRTVRPASWSASMAMSASTMSRASSGVCVVASQPSTRLRLRRVAAQVVDLRRPQVRRVESRRTSASRGRRARTRTRRTAESSTTRRWPPRSRSGSSACSIRHIASTYSGA